MQKSAKRISLYNSISRSVGTRYCMDVRNINSPVLVSMKREILINLIPAD